MFASLSLECVAYVGPGAGLTMLGALLAVVIVILMALLSPIYFLIVICRRWIRRPLSADLLPLQHTSHVSHLSRLNTASPVDTANAAPPQERS
jgi:hypothetical protein